MPPASKSDPLVVPAGFKRPPIPADNPITAEKVTLGRQLFYEVKLSRDNSLSCAGCHQPSASFSDAGKSVSAGISGQVGKRNAPSLVNIAYDTTFFWDGRAHTLEQQATMPITNPIEMGSVGVDSATVLKKLAADPYYLKLFENAFGDSKITFDRIGKAIASFERTLISGNSAYDRMKFQHDSSAMSASALRGMALFFDQSSTGANCVGCHSGDNFTDNGFYATGFTQEYYNSDPGRATITKQDSDIGRFKTPTLRNVALTAPYAANGGTATLYDMIKHYNDGGNHTRNQDSRIRPLNLTDEQMNDLVAFLNSLTDVSFTKRSDFQKPN
jgi:cytochrome c peroxidase